MVAPVCRLTEISLSRLATRVEAGDPALWKTVMMSSVLRCVGCQHLALARCSPGWRGIGAWVLTNPNMLAVIGVSCVGDDALTLKLNDGGRMRFSSACSNRNQALVKLHRARRAELQPQAGSDVVPPMVVWWTVGPAACVWVVRALTPRPDRQGSFSNLQHPRMPASCPLLPCMLQDNLTFYQMHHVQS